MKKSHFLIAVFACLGAILLAYFSYPLVTGIVDRRRLQNAVAVSDSSGSLPQGELVIVMSAEKATELISGLDDGSLPLENVSVAFGDGVIVVEGTALRDRLMPGELLSKYPNLRLIKGFLPESCEVGVSFSAEVEYGELKITPESFTLQEYQLPLSFLPLEIRDAVGELITGKYLPEGLTLRSVEVGRGKITVAMD